jgi:hypothetical protein
MIFILTKIIGIENINALPLTPRICNGGLLVVHRFALRIIVRVPGQVIALNSATAHTRKRCKQVLKTDSKPKLKIT